jgi:hypothetical protein
MAVCQCLVTICSDELPGLRIADATVTEGNSGTKLLTFNVTLTSAAATAVTFNASTQSNTAAASVDFASLPLTAFSIPAGQLAKAVTVTINGDTTVENDETFFVWLSAVTGATLADGQGIGTVANDDGPGLRIANASISEGNSGTKLLSFTVTLTQAATYPVIFKASTQSNTAAVNSDFVGFGATAFDIPAGQVSRQVSVTINGDTAVEANETFFVNVWGVSGAVLQAGQGVGTITNDD